MNGVVRCKSPGCWTERAPSSKFCHEHLEIFARVRAELEAEDEGKVTCWSKGVLRNASVKRRRMVVADVVVVDDFDEEVVEEFLQAA